MPTVPRYSNTEKQDALPSARLTPSVTPDSLGAGLGEGVSNAGASTFKIYQEEKRKADQIATMDADSELAATSTDLLNNPQTGALNRRGRDAFGTPETTLKAFNDRAGEIEKRLTNDEQRLAFRQARLSRQRSLDDTLQRHVSQEIRSYDDQTTNGFVSTEIGAAITEYQDPQRIALAAERVRAAVADHGARNGQPPEAVQAGTEKALNELHAGVIDRMLANGQDQAAQDYFNKLQGSGLPKNPKGQTEPGNIDIMHRPRVKNADGSTSTVRSVGVNIDGAEVVLPTVAEDGSTLTPSEAIAQYRATGKHLGKFDSPANANVYAQQLHEQQAALLSGRLTGEILVKTEKALELGTLRGESQRQADAITTSYTDPVKALDAVKKIDDPKLRDAVQTRVEHDFALRKQAEAQQRQDAFHAAGRVLETQGGNLDAVPPGLLVGLEPAQHAALEARSRQIREGVQPVTDYQFYYDTMSLAASDGGRAQFVKMDLMQHRHELDNAKFDELTRLQASLRGGAKADDLLDGYRTKKQVVDDALYSVGMDPTVTDKTSKTKAAQVNDFRRQVDERVLGLQASTGRKATTQEVQKIVDTLLVQGTVPGSGVAGFFQTKRRAFEAKPGEPLVFDVNTIPPGELAKINAALKRANRPITPEAVSDLWARKNLSGAVGGQ